MLRRHDGHHSRIDTQRKEPLASVPQVNMGTHGGRFCHGRVGRTFAMGFLVGDTKSLVLRRALFLSALSAGLMLAPARAYCDEPRSDTEPYVMMESGEVTNVIDAFDDGDVFDANVSLGFEYSSKSSRIVRETNIQQPGLTTGRYTANTLNVADYSESTSRLVPRLDIGIYKDLALYLKLPIVLSNSRQLTGDGDVGTSPAGVQDVVLAGAPGDGRLFSLPFNAPDRSGLDYVAVGLDVNILSQHRDRTKPTWLFGVEGRFAVGEPMHACNANPAQGQVKCANPADVNRNGTSDGNLEGVDAAERDPGVSRGTIGLEVHTIMSKRIKYVEPYGGFKALFEFQQQSSDYGLTDLEGSLVNHPPLVGTVLAGIMVIPWENREKFGRLTFDLRVEAMYTSEGRDYSELFDAIGSSAAPTLRNPQWARFATNTDFSASACTDGDPMTICYPNSVVDETSQKTYSTGLTDVQAFGSYRISGSGTWQAGKFFKLNFGMGLRGDGMHGITGDQPCNPAVKDDIGKSGPCKSGDYATGFEPTPTGIPNPNYRPSINTIGRRFFVANSTTFDLSVSATVMF